VNPSLHVLDIIGLVAVMVPGLYVGRHWVWGRPTRLVMRFAVAAVGGFFVGCVALILLDITRLPWFVALGLAFDGAMAVSALLQARLRSGPGS